MVAINESGFGSQMRAYGDAHGGWGEARHILTKESLNLTRVLVRDKPKVEFCLGTSGNDRLIARPLIASDDAVDRQRRTNRRTLIERVAALAPALVYLSILEYLRIRGTCTRHVGAFLRAPVPHAVVKA